MTGGQKINNMVEYDPLGEFFKDVPFGGADDMEEMAARYQPLRGKSNGAAKRKNTGKNKKAVGPTMNEHTAMNMMNY
jgi:hypothetical protein